MCCNSIILFKKQNEQRNKTGETYLAFSLLSPEYYKALRFNYFILGTTGLI